MSFSDNKKSDVICSFCGKRNDQVKRMLAYLGKPVLYLERISMGNMTLDPELSRGKYRFLTPEEVENLRKH